MSEILSKQSQKEVKSKSVKKYKCPYCELRLPRTELGNHIDDKHYDLIPKGYTANRIAFNTINKKEHGRCVVCGKESPWNEDKCRYDRFCGDKKCIKKYAENAEKNTGQHKKMKDMEYQANVMQTGRKISGVYTFTDGNKMNYVGSYERNFLEFMDKIMKVKYEDIQQPGPTIEYEYNSKKHKWITDFYYIPYNLAFDIKDGGDNPNTRPMKEYREKQIAKEKAIVKQGKYNYIRATNNEYEQVFNMMAELKELMYDENPNQKPIHRIHEFMSPGMFSLPRQDSPDSVYLLSYNLMNNVFIGKEPKFALCKNYMSDIVTFEDGEFEKVNLEEFIKYAQDIKCFKYKEDVDYLTVLRESKNDKDFYENLTGKRLLNYDQIYFDNCFEQVQSFIDYLSVLSESLIASALHSTNNTIVTESSSINIPIVLLEQDDIGIQTCRDIDGIFIRNEPANIRSRSYNSKDDIPKDVIKWIRSL